MLHPIFIILTRQLQWCYELCHWHDMLLVPVPPVSKDQESHIASHYNHLELTNGMVLLMTLLAPCDSDTSVNGIIWPNSYVVHCSNCLNLMGTMILLVVTVAWCDADASANSVKWLKKSYCISFQSPWANKRSDAIGDAISVMWCQHWHYMTKKVMVYHVWVILPSKQNGKNNNAINIVWCSHWFQQHHMIKRVMLHLVLIFFT